MYAAVRRTSTYCTYLSGISAAAALRVAIALLLQLKCCCLLLLFVIVSRMTQFVAVVYCI